MNPDLARVLIVAAVLAAALGLAGWLRARAAGRGDPVDVSGLVDGPAIVVFTKDDCATCVAALERVSSLGLPIRQVRAEDEPDIFEERAVTAVPLTVVVNSDGSPGARFGGDPPRRPLQRAVRRAR
ncbi:MAG: hypothetical protein ACR2OI_01510 [Acidimicrobiia bacterium]